ncbi:hypothetical protein [Spiroplasma endosymbiont of Clivina fossor]|uniref:hypothetical protein n=1 Tax=Spiroplasma endosymbiont of Clivina fossor TaxID=3066282 RepID=UPI00313CCECD
MNSETVASVFTAIIGGLGGTAGITGIISALKTKKEAKKMEQENKEALNKIDTKLMIINNKIDMVIAIKNNNANKNEININKPKRGAKNNG